MTDESASVLLTTIYGEACLSFRKRLLNELILPCMACNFFRCNF